MQYRLMSYAKNTETILISSHQLSEMERMVDWVGIIHEGNMIEECSYQQLKENEYSYIRLVVKEPEEVCKYLKNNLSIEKTIRSDASVIEIYDLKYGTLELNSKLFAAGFVVAEISKCQNSLEDYFKELTGVQALLNAIFAEIMKQRKNRMLRIGTFAVAVLPFLLLMKSLFLDKWRDYMDWIMMVMMLNTLVLPIASGFVLTVIVQKEYQDMTIRNILVAPARRGPFCYC